MVKFYRVCTRADNIGQKNVNASNLVNVVMGYNKPVQTITMKHGLAMEPHANRKLVEVLKDQKHVKVCSGEAGLFVSPNYPHLGASPDLIISCGCHEKFVVEIKCPDSIKMNTPSEHNLDYLVSDNSITKLKERHSYYFQFQGQMGITEIKQAILFIYTHHGYFIQFIEFDSDLSKQMIFKFNYFWSKYIASEILNSNCVHNSTLCSKDINTQPFVSLLSENNNKDTSSESVCGFCFNVATKQPKSQCDYSILCELMQSMVSHFMYRCYRGAI